MEVNYFISMKMTCGTASAQFLIIRNKVQYKHESPVIKKNHIKEKKQFCNSIQSNLSMWSVTCIKRSHFSCPFIDNFIRTKPLLRGHMSYKATFSLSQRWPLNTGLTVHVLLLDYDNLHTNHNFLEYTVDVISKFSTEF